MRRDYLAEGIEGDGVLSVHFSPDEVKQLEEMIGCGGVSDNKASGDFYKLLQDFLGEAEDAAAVVEGVCWLTSER